MSKNFSNDDQLLTSLFDGELSDEQRAAAEQLLAGNPEYQAQFEAWQKMGDRLRRLPRYQLRPEVSGKVLEEISKRQALVAKSVTGSASVANSHGSLGESSVVDVASKFGTVESHASNSSGASVKFNWRGGLVAIASLAALLLATLFVFPNLVNNPSDAVRLAERDEVTPNKRLEIGKDATPRADSASAKSAAAAFEETHDARESGESFEGGELESFHLESKSAASGGESPEMLLKNKGNQSSADGAGRKNGLATQSTEDKMWLEPTGRSGEQSRMSRAAMGAGQEMTPKPASELADESRPMAKKEAGGFGSENTELASVADEQQPQFGSLAIPSVAAPTTAPLAAPLTNDLAGNASSFSASASAALADEAVAVPPLQQILWIDVDAEVLLAGEAEESALPALTMVTQALQRNSITMVLDSSETSLFDQNAVYRDAPDEKFKNDAGQSPAEQSALQSLDGKATPGSREKALSARVQSAQLQSLKSTVPTDSPAGVEAITVVATAEQMKQAVIEISNNAKVSGFEIPRQRVAAQRLRPYPLSNTRGRELVVGNEGERSGDKQQLEGVADGDVTAGSRQRGNGDMDKKVAEQYDDKIVSNFNSDSPDNSLEELDSEALKFSGVAPADLLNEADDEADVAKANLAENRPGKVAAKESEKKPTNDQSPGKAQQPQPSGLEPTAPESQVPKFESNLGQSRYFGSGLSGKPSLARQSELEAIDRWFDGSNLDARVDDNVEERANDKSIRPDSVSPPDPTAPPQVQYLLLIRTSAAADQRP